jgi:hypothetical protein
MEAGGACIPYSRRPEWADIEPLPPPPGDAGKVVSIQYAERHAEALGYFRAILAKVRGVGVHGFWRWGQDCGNCGSLQGWRCGQVSLQRTLLFPSQWLVAPSSGCISSR